MTPLDVSFNHASCLYPMDGHQVKLENFNSRGSNPPPYVSAIDITDTHRILLKDSCGQPVVCTPGRPVLGKRATGNNTLRGHDQESIEYYRRKIFLRCINLQLRYSWETTTGYIEIGTNLFHDRTNTRRAYSNPSSSSILTRSFTSMQCQVPTLGGIYPVLHPNPHPP